MLTSLTISKLFNLYSYTLDFRTSDTPVFFITGPNGYGKTSILNIINYIYVGNYEELSKITFEKVSLAFTGGAEFTVEQSRKISQEEGSDEVSVDGVSLKIRFRMGSDEEYTFDWIDDCEAAAIPDPNIKLFFDSHPVYYIRDGRLMSLSGNPAIEVCVDRMKEFLRDTSVCDTDVFKAKKDVFMKIIGTSDFADKTLQLDPRYGFRYILNNEDKTILSPCDLSSGERHLTVMAFELIFMAPDDSLVLIDEPEISFHMLWQVDFLKNINRILDVRKLQCIVATHSPQIFNMKWGLTVDLFKQSQMGLD